MKYVTLDFETYAIEKRPAFPPKPVGLAVVHEDGSSHYMAFGHPSGNTCSEHWVRRFLSQMWMDESICFVFHNAAFDLAICYEYFKLPVLPWHRVHDTMFLLYLADPHSPLGLKEAAKRHLRMDPHEQKDLYEYLWSIRAQLPAKPCAPTKGRLGAFIAYAPAELVEPYAVGDVIRTFALFNHLHPSIVADGMEPAYNLELQLLPILMENERLGICVDVDSLSVAVPVYQDALRQADDEIRTILNAPGLSVDNDGQYADLLIEQGIVDRKALKKTKTGKSSVAKTSLKPDMYNNQQLAALYTYRGKLATCLRNFLEPWLDQATQTNTGRIHPQWNQVRSERGGTTTGRPSMTNPNLLNVAKPFDDFVYPQGDYPGLPDVRNYILADPGHVWVHRDYDGQELRIYAHFERGEFYHMYQADPNAKPHDMVRAKITEALGKDPGKTLTKNVNFGRIYGAGQPRIAELLDGDMNAAKSLINAHAKAMPSLATVNRELKNLSDQGSTIRTLGGRRVTVEPAKEVDGQWRTMHYKLLNHLVQGSAADATKRAIVTWYNNRKSPMSRLMLTVYDEINISSPAHIWEDEDNILSEAMSSVPCGVPLLSNRKVGSTWGAAK